jgi:hypothetical protein
MTIIPKPTTRGIQCDLPLGGSQSFETCLPTDITSPCVLAIANSSGPKYEILTRGQRLKITTADVNDGSSFSKRDIHRLGCRARSPQMRYLPDNLRVPRGIAHSQWLMAMPQALIGVLETWFDCVCFH